ncbi:hypothetical protein DLD77_00680 [Chitinophaga alhagiae]|uniref:Uncharacterized protein n=1 Tax=Chitinophaga alhagiae TaxID=2203219 RepID=A0ABN5LRH7_9BACT|nr:hypothetical protein [Chitinophaga alhagiae]AWO00325.1 hypothetical protein DLD77_00680 [Chitinophaga alhagiae]
MDVIQVYKFIEWFGKDTYETAKQQFFAGLEEDFPSRTGFLENHVLYLPYIGEQPDLRQSQTVIIQDTNGPDPFSNRERPPRWLKDKGHTLLANGEETCIAKSSGNLVYDIFRIEKTPQGTFSLFLNYTHYSLDIGIPSRNNHKIADIKPGEPVRYRLNGKSDFTMTGRKERAFLERDYLFEYAGQANSIVFLELNKIERTKTRAGKPYKLVDERKILY